MKIRCHSIQLTVLTGCLLTLATTYSQVAGDEDKEMFNRAKQRDQQAIDQAISTWWTRSMQTHDQRIAWWREAKFGMFIHWGIYSLPGGEWKGKKVSGYAEHLMRKEKITRQDYIALARQFNPAKFNAEEWILHAKNAGMKYFIITAKHHDGFALYDSKVSKFDITDQTKFEQDPLAELATAARKHGVKFGFYYSHAFDWEHPDAPGNDWEYNNPGGDKLLGGSNWFDTHPEWLPRAQRYVTEKAIPQIKELISRYHPDILWFDTPHKLPLSENIRILQAIRETDPSVVVNGRLVRSSAANFGDYRNTADRPAEFFPVTGDWEAIPTTNESYGYHKFDSSHKTIGHFVQLLAKAASRGGNLLMNIGPMGDGAFDPKDLHILKGIGAWMKINGESIYGTTASPLPLHSWGVSTLRQNKLYLHVFDWPANGKLIVSGIGKSSNPRYLANPSQAIRMERLPGDYLQLIVSKKGPDSINSVIVLDWESDGFSDSTRVIVPGSKPERLLAFDATLSGNGFNYGDGKTNRYYAEGWKNIGQTMSWPFRTTVPGPSRFRVVIKYLAPLESSGGVFSLVLARPDSDSNEIIHSSDHSVLNPAGNNTVVTTDLGNISLGQGFYALKLVPRTIIKSELMKLLEVQLIPIDKN